MREILFKAKRKDNGEWVEGLLVFLTKINLANVETVLAIQRFALGSVEIDDSTICQYTGLTDKNGNKIWENDVVEIPREDDYFKVMWSDTEARYEMQSDSLVVDFDNYWSYEVEVIGNIFDNPELIGE